MTIVNSANSNSILIRAIKFEIATMNSDDFDIMTIPNPYRAELEKAGKWEVVERAVQHYC